MATTQSKPSSPPPPPAPAVIRTSPPAIVANKPKKHRRQRRGGGPRSTGPALHPLPASVAGQRTSTSPAPTTATSPTNNNNNNSSAIRRPSSKPTSRSLGRSRKAAAAAARIGDHGSSPTDWLEDSDDELPAVPRPAVLGDHFIVMRARPAKSRSQRRGSHGGRSGGSGSAGDAACGSGSGGCVPGASPSTLMKPDRPPEVEPTAEPTSPLFDGLTRLTAATAAATLLVDSILPHLYPAPPPPPAVIPTAPDSPLTALAALRDGVIASEGGAPVDPSPEGSSPSAAAGGPPSAPAAGADAGAGVASMVEYMAVVGDLRTFLCDELATLLLRGPDPVKAAATRAASSSALQTAAAVVAGARPVSGVDDGVHTDTKTPMGGGDGFDTATDLKPFRRPRGSSFSNGVPIVHKARKNRNRSVTWTGGSPPSSETASSDSTDDEILMAGRQDKKKNKAGGRKKKPQRPRGLTIPAALDVTWALSADRPTDLFWKVLCETLVPKLVRDVLRDPAAMSAPTADDYPASSAQTIAARYQALMCIMLRLPCARTHLAKAVAEACLDFSSRYLVEQRTAEAAVLAMTPTPPPHAVSLDDIDGVAVRPRIAAAGAAAGAATADATTPTTTTSPAPTTTTPTSPPASPDLPRRRPRLGSHCEPPPSPRAAACLLGADDPKTPIAPTSDDDLSVLLKFVKQFAQQVAAECREHAEDASYTSWLTLQVEMLVRAATYMLRVGVLLDSEPQTIVDILSVLLPVRPHTASYVLQRLHNALPSGNATRTVAWMQFAQVVLLTAPPAQLRDSRQGRTLLNRLIDNIGNHHAAVSHSAISLCSNMYVLMQFVLPSPALLSKLTSALQANRSHWCDTIVELSEQSYETLLDLS